jgi:purine-binding chemotaxis protein CheW
MLLTVCCRLVGELRNVIVFAVGSARYAVELRWIREVVTLGFVTAVPTAPPVLGGVCNLHGTILPVLDLLALLDQAAGPTPRQGDGALVLESEGTVCALRVDQIDHVASLPAAGLSPATSISGLETGSGVVDTSGRPLVLLDPQKLVRKAVELVGAATEPTTARA